MGGLALRWASWRIISFCSRSSRSMTVPDDGPPDGNIVSRPPEGPAEAAWPQDADASAGRLASEADAGEAERIFRIASPASKSAPGAPGPASESSSRPSAREPRPGTPATGVPATDRELNSCSRPGRPSSFVEPARSGEDVRAGGLAGRESMVAGSGSVEAEKSSFRSSATAGLPRRPERPPGSQSGPCGAASLQAWRRGDAIEQPRRPGRDCPDLLVRRPPRRSGQSPAMPTPQPKATRTTPRDGACDPPTPARCRGAPSWPVRPD